MRLVPNHELSAPAMNRILLTLTACALAAGCAAPPPAVPSAPPPAASAEAPDITLLAPADGAVVPLLSEGQKAFFDLPEAERRERFRDPAWRHGLEQLGHRPQAVRLRWSWTRNSDPPGNYRVALERRGLGDLDEFEPAGEFVAAVPWLEIPNLESGRTYRWTVSGENRGVASGTFSTEARAPRLLDVPGIPNARDLGGWTGRDGRRVRQGVFFRTAGLNDNASDLWYTREELEAADTNGALAAAAAALDREEGRIRALEESLAAAATVPAAPAGGWTFFRVAETNFDDAAVAALREVPATFLGAAAETLPEDGTIGAPGQAAGPAVLLLPLDAEADGHALVTCGADWWWTLRVNGDLLVDRLATDGPGNERWPVAAGNHSFLVPVRKGRNLLAAVVRTGTAGWRWCFDAAPAAATPADAFADARRFVESRRKALWRVRKGFAPGASRVTAATRELLIGRFGVRTDVDLRSDGECRGMEGSPLGPEVRWAHVSSAAYGDLQLDWGRDAFRRVFEVFLDPDAAGIDFHCIAGQDRTGAVSFVVLALLGVSEEDLARDWEATALWNPFDHFNHEARYDKLVRGFDRWPGETINERVEAYVLSLGFSAADLDAFRERLLEPPLPRCHEGCK